MYSTSVVLPADVGPSSNTGQGPDAIARASLRKLTFAEGVKMNLLRPEESGSDQSIGSFGPA